MKYYNPIITGCNPDPSICRAGEDYYVVTSTFEYFPGIPIYHSRNLVNWELRGYCLEDASALALDGCAASGGVYAPTIRYHEGTFFVTSTNVTDKGNFIIHTKDLEKGWSKPVWVKQGGIDPSLFFDDDGKVYYTTSLCPDGENVEIWVSEVNPYTGEMLSEARLLSKGCGGKNPEAPHLYKIDGTYYLMLAEGGTEYCHSETIQRAKQVYGPYEPCPHNPIVTHRDQTRDNIHCIGHGDLVEDQNGNWWMVCLGIRTCSKFQLDLLLHNLGRETFLAPVRWEDGWPVVGKEGHVETLTEAVLPGCVQAEEGTADIAQADGNDFYDDFSSEIMSLHYNYIRNPKNGRYIRDVKNKRLVLHGSDVTLNETASPVWIGVRQKAFEMEADVTVGLSEAAEGARAGLTAYYNENYHYEIYLTEKAGRMFVALAKKVHDIFVETDAVEIGDASAVTLRIRTGRDTYTFSYSTDGENYHVLGSGATAGLCTEGTMTMTFTGVYLAMFAERGTAYFENLQITEKKGEK